MSMQPSQKAFETAKGYLSSLGASMDAGRALSLDAVAALDGASNHAEAGAAARAAAKGALSQSMRDRGAYFEGVGQSRLASQLTEASSVTRQGKGMDAQWGPIDVTHVNPKTYLDNWSKTDPKSFEGFQKQVASMAQDFAALSKISPATANVTADLVVIGNAKCSDVVRHAVAMKIKEVTPETPKTSQGLKL